MPSYCYISIVGTQFMGTLNPLLSLKAEGMDISTVALLITPQLAEISGRLTDICSNRGFNVATYPIDFKAKKGNDSAEIVSKNIMLEAKIRDEHCIFNANGGTNLLITGSVLSLSPYSPLIVQSLRDGIVLTDLEKEEQRYCKAPVDLTPQELLQVQGVPYEKTDVQPGAWTAKKFCERNRIPLPPKALTDTSVSGINFDIIWNKGNNRLAFLYTSVTMNGRTRNDLLLKERDLAHWASTRDGSLHLYDRFVYALAGSVATIDHLKKEGGKKIDVCDVTGWEKYPKIIQEHLQDMFKPTPVKAPRSITLKKRNPVEPQTGSLVVMLAEKSPSATCIAIRTHTPRKLVLCHTSDTDPAVTKRWREYWLSQGIEEVRLVPCDYSGSIIPSALGTPQDPSSVIVNTTPGTKGHAVFLSLWAKKHGCQVWSLDTYEGLSIRLDGEGSLNLKAPDPLDLLELRGISCKTHDDDLEQDKPANTALLSFLRAALGTPNAGKIFKKGTDVTIGPWHMGNKGKNWVLENTGTGEHYLFIAKGGLFLETLAAQAFRDAGASHVHARLRFEASEDMKIFAEKKHQTEDAFTVDIDVAGSFGSSIFLVSCKSNPYTEITAPAHEALCVASDLDRFCLPMLCHLGCKKAFYDENSKVYVFGWRELCQPERIQEIINQLRKNIK